MASSSPVTAESLRDLQSKMTTARNKITKLRNDHDKAEYELGIIKKSFNLDYILERNDKKLTGTTKEVRATELEEILDKDERYVNKRSSVNQLLREKRDAEDTLSSLETQLKIDLSVFEDDRHKANRALLIEVLKHEMTVTPVEVTVKTLASAPLQDTAKRSLYSDLG